MVGDTISDGCEVTRLAGPFQRLTGLTDSVFLNRNRGSAMRAGCYVRIGSAILPLRNTYYIEEVSDPFFYFLKTCVCL